MERMTIIDGCGNHELARCMDCGLEKAGQDLENCGMCEEGWQRALRKLAAYEDTGLEPDRVLELAKAEQDERLVVLPFQQGKTLVDRTFPENTQLLKNVRVAVAYDSSGIIFHYPFNTFIQNVKSGCIFQVSEEMDVMLAQKGDTHETNPV